MKKVILGAFMLLAVAGTTMAQTAKKDTAMAASTSKMNHGKMHHGKKHHHHPKMSAMKKDDSKTQK
jgi:hypothetical protein